MEIPNKIIKETKSTMANIDAKLTKKLKSIPLVRQTLTSYKRMLNANPLLKYQEAGIDVDQLLELRSTGTIKQSIELAVPNSQPSSTSENKASINEFKKPVAPFKRTQSLKIPKSNRPDASAKKPVILSGNLLLTNNHFKKTAISMSLGSNLNIAKLRSENTFKSISGKLKDRKHVDNKIKNNLLPKSSISLLCRAENNTKKAILQTENNVQKPNNQTLRRSLSSDEIQNKKDNKPNLANWQPSEKTSHNFSPEISPITDNTKENTDFNFKTQSAYERRSMKYICTPHSAKKISFFEASTPASIDKQNLQERLIKFIKSRGKPLLSSFQNLRCFGKKNPDKKTLALVDEENKENIEIDEEKLESENSKIVTTPETKRGDIHDQNDNLDNKELSKVAKKAMVELQELIREEYPGAQCLGWLELIKEKYKKADDEPEYWECRAAIEQSIGNVSNAVEFYKTAIIQGAEVSAVDKSLEQLLTEFSLLNISPKKSNEKDDGNKDRIVREARSVFKSTIIQCAVLEKRLKK